MSIPVMTVRGKTIAEAYEKALIALWTGGTRIKSQYDKPDDLPTVDASMSIVIENPWMDPMIHKAFPGGIADLREYVFELQGLKDTWVRNMNDETDKRWEYTYHQRLASYGTWWEKVPGEKSARKPVSLYERESDPEAKGINQIEAVITQLIESSYTRRAQAITWMPNLDLKAYDCPCLQSLWYRMTEEDGAYCLDCDVRFRSNDAWGANFMNMFGFTHFNRVLVADEIQRRTAKKVELGRLWWVADSFHIYGKDQKIFKERFYDRLSTTSFEERVFHYFDPQIQEMWEEAAAEVAQKIDAYAPSQGD